MSKQAVQSVKELKAFFILWSTQSLSQLGSSMTAFALTLWLYEKTGSALQTALLAICTYVPYILMSVLAGALSDRWNKKKTMLVCDSLAALCTVITFIMLKLDVLETWHLYVLNAINGLMNTVQQPAGEVAMTMIIPPKYYQRASGLRSLSQSLITILNPILAAALFSFLGMEAVIAVDLGSFLIAFAALGLFVNISDGQRKEKQESVFKSAKNGLLFLKRNPLIFSLILFMAGVNFVASAFDAVLPAYVLSSPSGGQNVLGAVTASAGIATLIGSGMASLLPKPKDRIRVIYLTMLISLSTENFLLAFVRQPILWCIGQVIGWVLVPVMSANMDVILRSSIPVDMQGRVYACRNTLQFFTIPIGLFIGGIMVDDVCEPLMEKAAEGSLLRQWFGAGKGSGAALVMFILGVLGAVFCLVFGRILKKYHYEEKA
ncbi:MAG: MFS transporter [Lachnospiraceae bacterium]|jgi:MFS family permease|nr:MFS transporter [Lachnospiraceae bacterium]